MWKGGDRGGRGEGKRARVKGHICGVGGSISA